MDNYRKVVKKNKKSLLSFNNVVGVGYGAKEKNGEKIANSAIVVLVDKKIPHSRLNKNEIIPRSIDDLMTDVIEIGEITLLSERTDKIRPAQPGVSIGHYKISAGTLGAIVKDNKTGQKLILSNNHVLANITNGHDKRSEIGDPILQPGSYDDGAVPGDVIAKLERFIPIKRSMGESTCSIAIGVEQLANFLIHLIRPAYHFKIFKEVSKANLVDCAVALPVSQDAVKTDILDLGKVKGVKEAEVGMVVKKSGRTTGVTSGKVKVLDATVEVNLGDGEKAVFDEQIVTEPISKGGDSGSLVLDKNNNAVGLLFAGSEKATVCNCINNVIDALDVNFSED